MIRIQSYRREFLRAFVGAGAAALSACYRRPELVRWRNQIGDLVTCGKLNYTVLEVVYKSQLGSGPVGRLPKSMFIAIRIQATTSADNTSMPMLRLEAENETMYPELVDASDQEGWLGILRRVQPGTTEDGWIVFDAPPSNYGLWLSDGKLEDEQKMAVKIPIQISSGGPDSAVK